MVTCLRKILDLHAVCNFQTQEGLKVGPASNSEIKRWFNNKCVEVNFNTVTSDEPWPPVIKSLVLFPKNAKKRCTLIFDETITLIQIKEGN
jgi:hypothetical protein